MRLSCELELVEETIEDTWVAYDLFDQNQILVGKLYLHRKYYPPEEIELATGE